MKLFKMDELEIPTPGESDDGDFDTPLSSMIDDEDFDDSEFNIPLKDLIGEFGDEDFDLNAPLDDENLEMPEESDGDFDDAPLDDENLESSLFGDNENGDLGDPEEALEPEGDPNFQGIIRTVKGANLVYKRKQPDETYEELWIYNIGEDMKKSSQTRRAILAGTDIDPSTNSSETGSQSVEATTIGNVQFLLITALQN